MLICFPQATKLAGGYIQNGLQSVDEPQSLKRMASVSALHARPTVTFPVAGHNHVLRRGHFRSWKEHADGCVWLARKPIRLHEMLF